MGIEYIKELEGEFVESVIVKSGEDISDTVIIETKNKIVEFTHFQDCCEQVYLEGSHDLQSLVGEEIVTAEVITSESEDCES